jgi:hypothetical protein
MSRSPAWKGSKLETPAIYRIRVQGHLGGRWVGRVGGMVITSAFRDNGKSVTVLEGLLLDQAALSGVLNALHKLQLELLSVECFDIYQQAARKEEPKNNPFKKVDQGER